MIIDDVDISRNWDGVFTFVNVKVNKLVDNCERVSSFTEEDVATLRQAANIMYLEIITLLFLARDEEWFGPPVPEDYIPPFTSFGVDGQFEIPGGG